MTVRPSFDDMSHEDRRGIYLEVSAKVIVPVATVIFVVMVAALYVLYRDYRGRADENRVLIDRLAAVEIRQDREGARFRSQLKRSDVLNCQQIEKLKYEVRLQARRNYDRLDETLLLLGIPKTDAIEQRASEDLARSLTRYAPIAGGCENLPSARDNG